MASASRYTGPQVYKLYSEDHRLLYVGTTGTDERLIDHAKNKDWWPEVKHIQIDIYDSEEDASKAEVDAIHRGMPKYNIRHKPKFVGPNLMCVGCEVFLDGDTTDDKMDDWWARWRAGLVEWASTFDPDLKKDA